MNLNLNKIKSITFGAAEITEDNGEFSFYRFTRDQSECYKTIRKSDFFERTLTTAGIRLSFETDSSSFAFNYSHNGEWSAALGYFDVYINASLVGHLGLDRLEKNVHAEIPLGEGVKTVEVYFPWSKATSLSGITLDDGSYLVPKKRDRVAIMYGDSITHGYYAEYPSLSYASRISRVLGLDSYNKAVSNDRFFPEILDLNEPVCPEIVTVAYGINDWSVQTRDQLTNNSREYLLKLSKKFPDAKIFVISPIWTSKSYSEIFGGEYTEVHEILEANSAGLENVTLINGSKLAPHNGAFYTDGIHPKDIGFSVYAENLISEISKYL